MMGTRFRFALKRIAVAALFVPVLATCGGGGGGGDSGGGGGAPANTVAITGDFTAGNNASLVDKLFAKLFRSAYALVPSQVTRVILISVDGTMTSANVIAGRFTISATKGSPVGVIFVGASNNFLGYMSLGNGIDTLPLGKVVSGTTTIDLQTLSSTGRTVRGSRNPIGQELPLTPDEQAALKNANALFSAVIRSPDVDGNGVVDVLEGKHYALSFFYEVRAGAFGSDVVPTVDPAPTFRSFGLQLAVRDTNPPDQVFITGPSGSGLSNQAAPRTFLSGNFATYLAPAVFVPSIPVPGDYVVNFNSQPLTFNIPNQSNVTADIVLPVPTVTVNSNGTVQKVNWLYRLGSGAATLDPLVLMQRLEVSFWLGNPPIAPVALNGCTSSPHIAPAVSEFVPQCQTPINWSDVTRVDISYIDLYGNFVSVGWPKQTGF